MSKSKFSAVFESKEASRPLSEMAVVSKSDSFDPLFEQPVSLPSSAQVASPAKKLGGKKGNPDYCQVTAYLKRDTYDNVRIRLLQTKDARDFSELLEDLVVEFLGK
jgi:hypothetical protein